MFLGGAFEPFARLCCRGLQAFPSFFSSIRQSLSCWAERAPLDIAGRQSSSYSGTGCEAGQNKSQWLFFHHAANRVLER
ncbi:hypothetical protein X759_28375 [Mesorhizobium sp. LSHC420B00]|nr:hypothetical protein X759_28375 [Mesorhizobium sp. LSHC420B00]